MPFMTAGPFRPPAAPVATAPTTTSDREGHYITIRAPSRRDTLRITPDEVEEAIKEARVILMEDRRARQTILPTIATKEDR